MNTSSLHFRLIAWYSALVVLVVVILGALTYHSVQNRLTELAVKTLTRRAQSLDTTILDDLSPQSVANRIHAVYSPEANSRFIRIIKADGTVLYVSGPPTNELFDPSEIPLPPHPLSSVLTRQIPIRSGFNLLLITAPAKINGENWTVEIGLPTDLIDSALNGVLMTLCFTLPLLIVIAAAGGYYLVRLSLKPVEDIRATAEQITFGNLSSRLPTPATGDALEHLSITLNQMLERLETAYRQASRFSADASHELRTPLTIMRTELESILTEQLPQHLRERLGSVLEESEYMSRITESLFAISRLEAGEAKMNNTRIDLVQLVRSTVEQMHLLAEEKKIVMEINAEAEVPVTADQARLRQVVVNLLDNALKYTHPGGMVFIRISALYPHAYLEIRDNGIGIAEAALPYVFERFYRADQARVRSHGGAGLGLPIVRSVVQAHGGSVDINSVEGTGTEVIVELPLAER